MKLFKKTSFLIFLAGIPIIGYFLLSKPNPNHLSPVSPNNIYRQKLEKALFLANLKPQKLIVRDFIDEVEFYLDGRRIIFSTQKDPFWQVSSLQDILKIAKINHQIINSIDLNSNHPYATTL